MPRVQQGQSTTVHCWQHGYLDQRRRVGKLMTATSENDDWLTDELMQRASKLIQDIEAFPSQGTVYVVSRALYEAEKRGREEERERCAKIADEIEEREERIWIEDDSESGRAADAAEEIAAAIRGS